MRHARPLAVALLALVAAAPASQPASQPVRYTADEQKLHDAAASLQIDEQGEVDVKRIMGTPDRELRERDGKALYFKAGRLTVRCFVGSDWLLQRVDERLKD